MVRQRAKIKWLGRQQRSLHGHVGGESDLPGGPRAELCGWIHACPYIGERQTLLEHADDCHGIVGEIDPLCERYQSRWTKNPRKQGPCSTGAVRGVRVDPQQVIERDVHGYSGPFCADGSREVVGSTSIGQASGLAPSSAAGIRFVRIQPPSESLVASGTDGGSEPKNP